ncbi:hypothetical protein DF3PB_470010 [uncultured Defluviicoccus sp.]|uniref:Uncharacterized protein n=1 Tax=metagenome TaxID=256318 RepID=A0A380TIR3_9ZZZZ|nr:hypothetical protein DF3PB_470010 [uncultured Defluviicoccus sp.]
MAGLRPWGEKSKLEGPVLRGVAHPVVHEHEGGHGLDDHDGARDDAGIMAAAGLELGARAGMIDRLLRLHDRRRGLEGGAENQLLAVGDAPLHAAGAVRGGAHAPAGGHESVIVFRSLQQRAGEAAADLEALGRGQREHGLGQVRLQPVEDRLAQARGQAAHAALDDPADGIALGAHLLDALDHELRGGGVRTTHGVGLDLLERRENHGGRRHDIVDLGDESTHLDVARELQDLAGDGAGRDATDGLAGGGAPAAAVVADAVFGRVGEVGVRGTEFLAHLRVGLGPLVAVAHQHGQRLAGRATLEDAGQKLDRIGFLARRGDVALSRPAAVEVGLDLGLGQGQLRRAAIHDDPDRGTVAFAPGGDLKKFAEGIGHDAEKVGAGRESGKL